MRAPSRRKAQALSGDRDLFVVGIVVWVTAVIRVAAAVVQHEVFEFEATLALAAALVIPWFLLVSHRQER